MLGLIAFALPEDLSEWLTFSTYEPSLREAPDLHVVATWGPQRGGDLPESTYHGHATVALNTFTGRASIPQHTNPDARFLAHTLTRHIVDGRWDAIDEIHSLWDDLGGSNADDKVGLLAAAARLVIDRSVAESDLAALATASTPGLERALESTSVRDLLIRSVYREGRDSRLPPILRRLSSHPKTGTSADTLRRDVVRYASHHFVEGEIRDALRILEVGGLLDATVEVNADRSAWLLTELLNANAGCADELAVRKSLLPRLDAAGRRLEDWALSAWLGGAPEWLPEMLALDISDDWKRTVVREAVQKWDRDGGQALPGGMRDVVLTRHQSILADAMIELASEGKGDVASRFLSWVAQGAAGPELIEDLVLRRRPPYPDLVAPLLHQDVLGWERLREVVTREYWYLVRLLERRSDWNQLARKVALSMARTVPVSHPRILSHMLSMSGVQWSEADRAHAELGLLLTRVTSDRSRVVDETVAVRIRELFGTSTAPSARRWSYRLAEAICDVTATVPWTTEGLRAWFEGLEDQGLMTKWTAFSSRIEALLEQNAPATVESALRQLGDVRSSWGTVPATDELVLERVRNRLTRRQRKLIGL